MTNTPPVLWTPLLPFLVFISYPTETNGEPPKLPAGRAYRRTLSDRQARNQGIALRTAKAGKNPDLRGLAVDRFGRDRAAGGRNLRLIFRFRGDSFWRSRPATGRTARRHQGLAGQIGRPNRCRIPPAALPNPVVQANSKKSLRPPPPSGLRHRTVCRRAAARCASARFTLIFPMLLGRSWLARRHHERAILNGRVEPVLTR